MTLSKALVVCCAVSVCILPLRADTNMVLGRVVGQNTLIMQSSAPNVVEGRELNGPQGIALDTTQSPPYVYVSDTGNNRVLGWRNSASFQNGAPADIVIGQKDAISTQAFGPGTSLSKGMTQPTGIAVDSQGNVWVIDRGNNRILRYPKPFTQTAALKMPDMVLGQLDAQGQPTFDTRGANSGGLSASSLAFTNVPLRGALVFDSDGNLWVTDSGNNRVLRFPAVSGTPGEVHTAANLVLGQKDFTTASGTSTVNQHDKFNTPSGLAFDASGNLFVADALHRVLMFTKPSGSGAVASRFLGEVLSPNRTALNPPNDKSLAGPQGLAMTSSGELFVSDTGNNRVLRYGSSGPISWPIDGGAPQASFVYGQAGFTANKIGEGAAGLYAPTQLVVTASEVFIVDALNNRVIVYPHSSTSGTRVLGQLGLDYNGVNLIEGKELNLVGGTTVGNTFFGIGGSAAVDSSGSVPRLYIADTANNRVLGYCDARKAKQGDKADLVIGQPDLLHSDPNSDSNGHRGSGPTDQSLSQPTGLAVDSKGNLFVADTNNGRVLRFAAPCNQAAGQQNFPHANLVLGQASFTTARTTDATPSTMAAPFGLGISPEGYLFVSDLAHNRVLRFQAQSGAFQNGQAATAAFGQTDLYGTSGGAGANQFNSPRYIAVDTSARLYVADYGNNRVLVFSNAATQVNQTLEITNSDASHRLNHPHGVFVSPTTGELWIAPANEARVLHYPEYGKLVSSPVATSQAATATGPLSVTLDKSDNPFVTEAGNRVAEYFPEVDPVNGASWVQNRPLAPGSIASVFAKFKSTSATGAPSLPLPRTLGGAQVIVNGTPAPLFYIGNSSYAGYVQINFQMPSNAPTSGFADMQVVDTTTQQVYGAGGIPMTTTAPAIFMDLGTGQVAAWNLDRNGKVLSCNGRTAPCKPVDPANHERVIFYLTGQGQQSTSGWPADGAASTTRISTDGAAPHVWIGAAEVPAANVKYSGTAPDFVGLWEIEVEVPNAHYNPGQPNPVLVIYRDVASSSNGLPSPIPSIVIK